MAATFTHSGAFWMNDRWRMELMTAECTATPASMGLTGVGFRSVEPEAVIPMMHNRPRIFLPSCCASSVSRAANSPRTFHTVGITLSAAFICRSISRSSSGSFFISSALMREVCRLRKSIIRCSTSRCFFRRSSSVLRSSAERAFFVSSSFTRAFAAPHAPWKESSFRRKTSSLKSMFSRSVYSSRRLP